ncbi:MAG: hypothetical protein ACO209_00530 [Aquirufa sp.]|jgi:hypothetical protein
MPTLWTFGDSFTKGHGMNGEIPEYINADKNYKWTNLLSNKLNFNLKDYSDNGIPNERILLKILDNIENFKEEDIVIIQSSTITRYEFPFYDKKKEVKDVSDGYMYFLNEMDSITYDMIKKDYETYDGNTISEFEFNASKDFMQYILPSTYYYRRGIVNLCNIAKYLHNKKIVKNVIFWNLESIRIDKIPNKQPLFFNIFNDYSFMENFYLHDEIHTGLDTYNYGWLTTFRKMKLTIWDDSNKSIHDFHLSKNGHIWFTNFILNKLKSNERIKSENII